MGLDYILYNGNEAFYALIGQNSFKPFTYGIHPEDVRSLLRYLRLLKKVRAQCWQSDIRGIMKENISFMR